ncbi:hypothetical protein [Lysobacter sp. CA196]|uniref:hypothetical protein n=1 Tax=Lysobacter sp. CA196 TaxID=3455606 RepID=UPI003F8D1AE6
MRALIAKVFGFMALPVNFVLLRVNKTIASNYELSGYFLALISSVGGDMVKLLVPRGSFLRDTEPTHISRLKEVAKWRLPEEGSREWVDFRLRSAAAEQDPRYRKLLRESSKIAWATMHAVERNGAGLPADSGVREFLSEYNRRTGNFGLHYLPASFNVFEAFSNYLPKYGVFVPLRESDFVCSIRGFLDYQASLVDRDLRVAIGCIPEGEIFNFSFAENTGDWILEEGGERFVISSFSMVRHAGELTAICLGGFERDLLAETSFIKSMFSEGEMNASKPLLEVDASLKAEAVALDREARFHRMYFGFRFDVDKCAMQTRYMLFDGGNSWSLKTDDPITLDRTDDFSGVKEPDRWVEFIEKRGGVFSFLARFFGLLAYFKSKQDLVVASP